jgi:hypothetical protein
LRVTVAGAFEEAFAPPAAHFSLRKGRFHQDDRALFLCLCDTGRRWRSADLPLPSGGGILKKSISLSSW